MSENKGETPAPVADKELDDLLESALADMGPKAPAESKGEVVTAGAEPGAEWNPEENVWSEEFLQQAAATFESNMAALLSSLKGCPEDSISQDQIAATFQMMAEAAAQVMKPGGAGENDGEPELLNDTVDGEEKPKAYNDVSAAISQALDSMNANAGNLQNQTPFSEDDLKNMFSGMNLNGQDDGSGNMFLPFMQGMMQSLLSKEVLYPSLKDIVDRYPDWLEKNESKLSKEDFNRYTAQNELMKTVCAKLESESENDSEEVKKERFEEVLKLMQQMQELGQPPEELSGELPGAPVGPMPPQMGGPDQCRPM